MSADAPIDPNKDLATVTEWRRLNVSSTAWPSAGAPPAPVRAYEDDWRSLARPPSAGRSTCRSSCMDTAD
jgi:hypothetical protein